jgi:prefoldin subunit 5
MHDLMAAIQEISGIPATLDRIMNDIRLINEGMEKISRRLEEMEIHVRELDQAMDNLPDMDDFVTSDDLEEVKGELQQAIDEIDEKINDDSVVEKLRDTLRDLADNL